MSTERLRITGLVPQSVLFAWEFTDGRTYKMEPLGGLWKGYGRLVSLQQTLGVLNRTQSLPSFVCILLQHLFVFMCYVLVL
jgi:hypothetical protein